MKRFSEVMKAKTSKMLDKAEDPRETLDYSYQRQMEMLTKVRRGVADVATSRKRVELQTAIDEVVFEARPGKRLQLGISIGAAIFPHDGNTYETLLATADSRMYRDKTKRKRHIARSNADLVNGGEPAVEMTGHELDQAASGIV